MTCKKRVWDNGDMTDCGKSIYGQDMCREHFINRRKAILEELNDLDLKIMSLNKELRTMMESTQ